MTANSNLNSAQRVLSRMAEQDAAGLYGFLRHFAATGDVEVLRDALDAGILQRLTDAGSPIFAAVAPLRNADVDDRTRTVLLGEWMSACGNPGQEAIDELLGSAKDAQSASDLIAFGANPNAWLDYGSLGKRTPLAMALGRGQTAVVRVMLDALVQSRQVPFLRKSLGTPVQPEELTSLFDSLAKSTVTRGDWSAEISVMDELRDLEIPREWGLEMGKALKLASQQDSFGAFEPLVTAPRAMLLARFNDAQSWYDVFEKSNRVVNLMIGREDTHEALVSIIKNALSDGANIDDIPSFVSLDGTDAYTRMTLLQNVVLDDESPDLTKTFIELGARLDVAIPASENVPEDLRGATLIEAARLYGHTDVEQILSSAIAKQRVDEVLERSRNHNRVEAP